MANLEGIRKKFTVAKDKDIKEHLNQHEQEELYSLLELVEVRKKVKKTRTADREAGTDKFYTPNTYLIINTDEPYADEVIDIMKKHGHWG